MVMPVNRIILMIVAASFAAVCEGWALAVKIGLNPATLHEAIKGGWAGSRIHLWEQWTGITVGGAKD